MGAQEILISFEECRVLAARSVMLLFMAYLGDANASSTPRFLSQLKVNVSLSESGIPEMGLWH